jgi:hypothetical protein
MSVAGLAAAGIVAANYMAFLRKRRRYFQFANT